MDLVPLVLSGGCMFLMAFLLVRDDPCAADFPFAISV